MTITAFAGPAITFGVTLSASGAVQDYNEHRGPSLADIGDGLLDPRSQYGYGYQPGQSATADSFGFLGNQAIVDFIPTTVSSNNIAALQQPVAGTALTLQLSASGIGYATVTPPEGGANVSLLYIDSPCGGSTNAGVAFGSAGSINIWNPASVCGRGVVINLSSNLDGGSWTIAGRDVYGFKVTESLAAGSTQLKSKKTYKYITAIQPSTTVTSTGVTVGTQDLYGFPLRLDSIGYQATWFGASSNATLVSLSTGAHTFAVTSAASNTTGDVRGTFASSGASNSSGTAAVRIQMFVWPSVLNSASVANNYGNYSGYFGLTQFSSV